jgi:hypothetical protein
VVGAKSFSGAGYPTENLSGWVFWGKGVEERGRGKEKGGRRKEESTWREKGLGDRLT